MIKLTDKTNGNTYNCSDVFDLEEVMESILDIYEDGVAMAIADMVAKYRKGEYTGEEEYFLAVEIETI